MSSRQQSNGYRGNVDRRFNDWHYTLPDSWWYIDLDGMEVCPRCRSPLLLTEQTRDPNKATSIIKRLSEMAGIPAALILLPEEPRDKITEDIVIQWRYPLDADWRIAPLGVYRGTVFKIRQAHADVCEGVLR